MTFAYARRRSLKSLRVMLSRGYVGGHGYVRTKWDRARCGGPERCAICAIEANGSWWNVLLYADPRLPRHYDCRWNEPQED